MLFCKSVGLALVPAVLPTLMEASHVTLRASISAAIYRGYQTRSGVGRLVL